MTSINKSDILLLKENGINDYSIILEKYNILLDFHGHVHDGQGVVRVRNSHIINAGPLIDGQFTKIVLKRVN